MIPLQLDPDNAGERKPMTSIFFTYYLSFIVELPDFEAVSQVYYIEVFYFPIMFLIIASS